MDTAQPTINALPPDIAKIVGQYVALRDKKRILEQQHKDAMKPFNEVMDQLEGKMLDFMQKTGSQSIATSLGTCYQSTRESATIKDGQAFRDWVIQNGRFDLIDWRANAGHVFDYLREHKVQPPGLNLSTYTSVNFRRPNE